RLAGRPARQRHHQVLPGYGGGADVRQVAGHRARVTVPSIHDEGFYAAGSGDGQTKSCLQRTARAPAVARNDSSCSPFQEHLRRGRPSESFRPKTYPARSGNDTLGSTQAIAKSASLLTLPHDLASLRVDP